MSILQNNAHDRLLEADGEYQRLVREHFECEAELERLSKDPYRSSEALLQEIELKKRKLRVKDRMEQLAMLQARAQENQ